MKHFAHPDLLGIGFLLIFIPLFFYHLGSYSLVDFDEAWFAEVARNIYLHQNPLVLTFNNDSFIEHPPFGFILMALSSFFFGETDFAARFFSALLGFLSVIVLYFIGKQLFNRVIGFCSSLFLVSCVWFIFRARTGSLDTIFLFFYLLTFYSALQLKKQKSAIYLVAVFAALLFLTKTVIGLTIFVPIGIYFVSEKIRLSKKVVILSAGIFLMLILPWLVANYLKTGIFFLQHLYLVGLRPFGRITPNYRDLGASLTFQYLHFGIRKWFYPTVIACGGGLIYLRYYRQLLPLYGLILLLLYGFLTNTKTEIWHLIPLYPFLGILTAFFVYQICFHMWGVIFRSPLRKLATTFTVILIFIVATLGQIYIFRNEVRLFDHGISGLAYTAQAASHHREPLYLYADYFLPSAVYYSKKPVRLVAGERFPINTLPGMVAAGPKPFLLIGEKWRFEVDHIDPTQYELLTDYQEYRLIRVR